MMNAVEQLLRGVPQVQSWEWERRKKHLRVTVFLAQGQKFFTTVSVSASDVRSRFNTVAQIKRQLREQGVPI